MRHLWRRGAFCSTLFTVVACHDLVAQWDVTVAGRATGILIHAEPAPYGAATSQLAVTQGAVVVQATLAQQVAFHLALNAEALTLPNGELNVGAWGEGFVDRRHPHTFVHELIAEAVFTGGAHGEGLRLGGALGKGFVPFGTDDPMNRPFSTFPINHHLAQLLERAVAVGQIGWGPAVLEFGLFNGDEPENPWQWPLIHQATGWRFGDSWGARLSVTPVQEVEAQLSTAKVHSPEHRPGAGGDQVKWSGSLRWERPSRGGLPRIYALVEGARTSELEGTFVFRSLLAEAAIDASGGRLAYRFERTDRPEEERPGDPFRTRRPHFENSILGTFLWSVHTVRVDRPVSIGRRGFRATPFIEGTIGFVHARGPGLVTPQEIYGTSAVRHLRLGVTVDWHAGNHRMGRYGLLSMLGKEMHH